jgi:hypothetical protein
MCLDVVLLLLFLALRGLQGFPFVYFRALQIRLAYVQHAMVVLMNVLGTLGT